AHPTRRLAPSGGRGRMSLDPSSPSLSHPGGSPVDSELHTTHLRILVDRLQRDEPGALDELLRRTSRRKEPVARAMLRRYPAVRAHEQTGDVVQEATLSLMVALRQLKFESTREFYGLATEHLRRRLIDLARRYANPHRNRVALTEARAADVAT